MTKIITYRLDRGHSNICSWPGYPHFNIYALQLLCTLSISSVFARGLIARWGLLDLSLSWQGNVLLFLLRNRGEDLRWSSPGSSTMDDDNVKQPALSRPRGSLEDRCRMLQYISHKYDDICAPIKRQQLTLAPLKTLDVSRQGQLF